jgi:hypothetical protein
MVGEGSPTEAIALQVDGPRDADHGGARRSKEGRRRPAYANGQGTKIAWMGTVSVRLALWGLECRTRHRGCWLISGRVAPDRAEADGWGELPIKVRIQR